MTFSQTAFHSAELMKLFTSSPHLNTALLAPLIHFIHLNTVLGVCRLEVQADVQKERCSLSGESGTVSLGTVSDNASTKAMAGSILNAYIPQDR